jgi:hypothetical protein
VLSADEFRTTGAARQHQEDIAVLRHVVNHNGVEAAHRLFRKSEVEQRMVHWMLVDNAPAIRCHEVPDVSAVREDGGRRLRGKEIHPERAVRSRQAGAAR